MKHNKRGFTLVEVLVVIFITAIISGFMVVNFRKGEETERLQRSAQRIAQTLRKAQNMALSSTEFTNPSTGQKEVSAGGYVVYFSPGSGVNTYYLYADFNSTKSESAGERIEAITLEGGVYLNDIIYIKRVGINEQYQSSNFTNIICKSPYASVEFQPPLPPADRVVVSITNLGATCSPNCCSQDCERGISCSADPGCRVVKINKDTGQIDIIK